MKQKMECEEGRNESKKEQDDGKKYRSRKKEKKCNFEIKRTFRWTDPMLPCPSIILLNLHRHYILPFSI
jgi:hypothetical protein